MVPLHFVWIFLKLVRRKRVVKRRVEENGSPPPCLDVFKISKERKE